MEEKNNILKGENEKEEERRQVYGSIKASKRGGDIRH